MRLTATEARERFTAAPVARLATVRPDGSPHVVPVTFAVLAVGGGGGPDDADSSAIAFAVDHKPKSTTALQRLRNIETNPRVGFLADRYDDDWTRLWWVRADAVAGLADGPDRERAVAALMAKYRQYRETPPRDAVVLCWVTRWSGWAARSP